MSDALISEVGSLKAAANLNTTDKVEIEQGADPDNESHHTSLAELLAWFRAFLSDADVPAAVVTESGAARTLALSDRGAYIRWTGTGAKTLTVNTDTGGASGEYHQRNDADSGDLTISASGVTVKPPKGGTLVLEPGDTVTIKRVASNVFHVFGSTKAAA